MFRRICLLHLLLAKPRKRPHRKKRAQSKLTKFNEKNKIMFEMLLKYLYVSNRFIAVLKFKYSEIIYWYINCIAYYSIFLKKSPQTKSFILMQCLNIVKRQTRIPIGCIPRSSTLLPILLNFASQCLMSMSQFSIIFVLFKYPRIIINQKYDLIRSFSQRFVYTQRNQYKFLKLHCLHARFV